VKRVLARALAFLSGDFKVAEGLDERPDYPAVPWITASATDEAAATYALEAAIRTASDAASSTKVIQDKAASFLTIILGLFPLAIAVTVLVVPSGRGISWTRVTAFVLFAACDLCLIGAAVMAFLSAGLVLTGGSNLAKFTSKPAPTAAALKAAEADAWYFAAELAMWSGHRKATDLFTARRLIVAALVVALLATPFIFLARSGVPSVSTPKPKTSGAAANPSRSP
jgi:hypothetical protein